MEINRKKRLQKIAVGIWIVAAIMQLYMLYNAIEHKSQYDIILRIFTSLCSIIAAVAFWIVLKKTEKEES